MADLREKFTHAAKAVSSNIPTNWEAVRGAFTDHLSGINPDSLPEKLQILFESVKLRVLCTIGQVHEDDAHYLAQDIEYMADVIRTESLGSQKSETAD